MIKIENINKAFKQTKVLNQVSFEIHQGDFIAVMGPSGSGKSTLLYSVSGMDTIDSGKITYQDVNISALTEKELSLFRLNEMGFVFQQAELLKNLSILDNITLPGLMSKKQNYEDTIENAKRLMTKMDIFGLIDRDVKEVSGGQLQRASICRAMINQPKILFLDEPTGALNSEATLQVLDILSNLNQEGITIMLVTHDKNVAARAKKVIYIIDGKLAGSIDFKEKTNHLDQLNLWLNQFKA
jgi:putative ABC transport system ATP-binding protein